MVFLSFILLFGPWYDLSKCFFKICCCCSRSVWSFLISQNHSQRITFSWINGGTLSTTIRWDCAAMTLVESCVQSPLCLSWGQLPSGVPLFNGGECGSWITLFYWQHRFGLAAWPSYPPVCLPVKWRWWWCLLEGCCNNWRRQVK